MPQPIVFPTAPADWRAFAADRIDARLARVDALAVELLDGGDRAAPELLALFNDLQIELHAARNETELLSEVHPDRAVREAAEKRLTAAEAKSSALLADPKLARLFAGTNPEDLDPAGRRVLEQLLRDFRRGGADLDDDARARVTKLAARDSELSLAFARNIREGRREIRVAPARLLGLPADFIARHPVGADGLVALSTDMTDHMPVQYYATDRELRHELARVKADLAWPENEAVLAELLQVRQERARLLGYGSWADYETDGRMAGSSARIESFLDEVDDASRASAEAEYGILLERLRKDHPDAHAVSTADQHHLLRQLHAERFAVDAQEVRSYFTYERVLEGILALTGRMFDVAYQPVQAPTWHEEVRSYDVVRDGIRIGRIHLDMHPREGKFNHAACFPIASGIRGRVLAEAALVCNFPTGLLEHRQVQTFFHEFGHLVHEILAGGQDWAAFAGIATEWDFVEAPSQMLEEWVWDAEVLSTFALNTEGEPIPEAIVQRMRKADAFGRALLVRTQLGHARVSYHLHADVPDDLEAATSHWYDGSTPVARLEGTHSYASFGHLTSYGACYYTYQWSLVIARDLLTGFASLMDPASARRYRREVLEPGGSRDAAELVRAFLGRDFSVDAYRDWLAEGATG